MPAGDQLVGCEGAGVSTVRVEGDEERRPLLDDACARVRVAVDAALMPLGLPEVAFQVQVVAGEGRVAAVDEQPGGEALHHARHMVVDGRRFGSKPGRDLVEVRPALPGRTGVWIERTEDEAELDDVPGPLAQGCRRRGEPVLDALRKRHQLAIAGPPFFDATQRWSESRTWPSASAIRRPGGSSGPPWSSFRIPRIPAAYSRTTSWALERRTLDSVEDAGLHRAKPTNLASHLDLRIAVELEHRLGEVAQEVVGAVPMRDPGEDLG